MISFLVLDNRFLENCEKMNIVVSYVKTSAEKLWQVVMSCLMIAMWHSSVAALQKKQWLGQLQTDAAAICPLMLKLLKGQNNK